MEVKRELLAATMFSVQIRRFNPCFDGSEARAGRIGNIDRSARRGFNPCFDGSEARVSTTPKMSFLSSCFNPCFDGSEARERASSNRAILY